MTYTQQKELVRKSLRNLRQIYRQADTAGETFERHLDRLISRKTLVTAADIEKVATEYKAWQALVAGVEKRTVDTVSVATA